MAAKRKINFGVVIRKIGLINNPPYLLTILLGLLLYSTNKIIDSELESPIVCYSLENISYPTTEQLNSVVAARFRSFDTTDISSSALKKQHKRFLVENISLSDMIQQLNLVVKFRDKDRKNYYPVYFFNEKLIPLPPASIVDNPTGDSSDNELRVGIPKDNIHFKISNFQPGTKYYLEFYSAFSSKIDADPVIYLETSSTVRLKEKGIFEKIMTHRLVLDVALLIFVFTLILVYFFSYYKSLSNEDVPNNSNV